MFCITPERELDEQGGPLIVSIFGGVAQILFYFCCYSMSLTPTNCKRGPENFWRIKSRALFQLILAVVGGFLLPLIAIGWSTTEAELDQNNFLWLLASSLNTVFMCFLIAKKAFVKLFMAIQDPKWPSLEDEQKMPSLVMEDCPTRKLYLRQDIYCFCWTICLTPY